jgi:hypothetical protein
LDPYLQTHIFNVWLQIFYKHIHLSIISQHSIPIWEHDSDGFAVDMDKIQWEL